MITLYGHDPIEPECDSLELSVWAWHALWTYLEEIHPDLACVVPVGADSEDVDVETCEILAMRLDTDVNSGVAARYVEERQTILRAMPGVQCIVCLGSGVRSDVVGEDLGMPEKILHPEVAVRLGRSQGWCNLCRGYGTLFDFEKSHELTINDIDALAGFLECCGGMNVYPQI